MFKRFRENIRKAVVYRRQAKLPNVLLIIGAITIFTLAYILLSVLFIPDKATLDYNFLRERGTITALSAIYMAMASAFSGVALVISIREKNRHYWLWVFLMLGFVFFAFDELLKFHEQADRIIGRFISPGFFRGWNDIVVILYGVIALVILVALLPSLLRYRMVLATLGAGFLFYGIHTVIDSTVDPRTILSTIIEESAKVISVEFLALGAFIGVLALLWNFSPPD